ncbi:MAG: sigma-70 family RNA polymerase sigma factor [Planctomycetes bacterium]|nr:sigma-70 family RNA polymerase sigma factor [Planctomycetota bacterium]
MSRSNPGEVTRILEAISDGDPHASDTLLPLVYDELRRLASARMALEAPGQTLQPTALVHEAYLRLVGDGQVDWENRRHFFGAAASAMRRILVERARRRGRIKHGGGRQRVPLDDVAVEADEKLLDYVVLDEALCRMEKQDERMSQIVMLRFFAGLTIEDTAQALGISPMTVKREWACARAWLYDELNSDEE